MERPGETRAITVLVELDDDGWIASAQGVADARETGTCLSEVRRRMQSLLSRRLGEVAIREQIRIDTDVTRRVDAVRDARGELEQAKEDLRESMVRTAAILRARGLSSRDVGSLLGVSQQRVSQLWKQGERLEEPAGVE